MGGITYYYVIHVFHIIIYFLTTNIASKNKLRSRKISAITGESFPCFSRTKAKYFNRFHICLKIKNKAHSLEQVKPL